MIHEEKCFTATCDNCGEVFITHHDGFSMFPTENDLDERLNNEDWYSDGTDPNHKGKQYCPKCFKHDEEIDDKILINLSRAKEIKDGCEYFSQSPKA